MKDLQKVNSAQLYAYWKELSLGILVVILTILLSEILPFYFSPIVSLVAAAVAYTMLYNAKSRWEVSCMITTYALFYCMIVFSFLSILLNVLYIWGIIDLPKEFTFFNYPYIPTLLFNPVCLVVLTVIYFRRHALSICRECKVTRGLTGERGKMGDIMSQESKVQLLNLIGIFTVLSIITTVYYLFFYIDLNVNARDWYIFIVLDILAFVGDEIYFAARYYNMYLDLKENGEIITEEELSDMTTKTYLRFYVICGNDIYLNPHTADPYIESKRVIDTPFVTKRNVNGITVAEVSGIIKRLCGIQDGKLRFFFGRKAPDMSKHRVLRYFYFLPGSAENYPDMKVDGEWMNFNVVKRIYATHPQSMARIFTTDLSRMTTIVLTQKIFDERGLRRNKLKSYRPTYDLPEIENKDYDFQDDKWVRVAMFNSDTRGYHVKKFFQKLTGKKNKERWEEGQ